MLPKPEDPNPEEVAGCAVLEPPKEDDPNALFACEPNAPLVLFVVDVLPNAEPPKGLPVDCEPNGLDEVVVVVPKGVEFGWTAAPNGDDCCPGAAAMSSVCGMNDFGFEVGSLCFDLVTIWEDLAAFFVFCFI